MFEMCFSTAPSVTTSSRAIAALVRPWAISSSVSRSRAVSASIACGRRPRAVAVAHQRADDLAVERGAAAGDPADRVDERPHLAHALLEQVADAALARCQQLAGVGRLDVLGEHQHGQLRLAAARLERGPDPLVGERRRQAHVADREVGLVALDDPQQPGPVLGLARRPRSRSRQQRDHPLAQQRVVLDDHDPHGQHRLAPMRAHRRRRLVDLAAGRRAPRRAGAGRSARCPSGSRRPRPSSAISTIEHRRRARARSSPRPRRPEACLAALVSDSATTK